MEAQARALLQAAVASGEVGGGLGTGIQRRLATLGGVELELPARSERPRAARLTDPGARAAADGRA
ncbi:MAG TPA: hypothetical protein VKU89_08830 [Solirubrobacteraceae bacterium]|nr:hypothetical protein [Solirubrobacteraceae bacterium]